MITLIFLCNIGTVPLVDPMEPWRFRDEVDDLQLDSLEALVRMDNEEPKRYGGAGIAKILSKQDGPEMVDFLKRVVAERRASIGASE